MPAEDIYYGCGPNNYLISDRYVGLWPSGVCPEGYHGDGRPASDRSCCRTCGNNHDQGTFPTCVSNANPALHISCPGADMSRWSNESNQYPNQTFISAPGVCVRSDGTPIIPPGCTQPTGCAYKARGVDDPYPTTSPPTSYYPCAPPGEDAACARDSFACDSDTGSCRAAANGVPLADCLRGCGAVDERRYKCDKDARQCKLTTDGTGLPLADCQESAPECAASGTLFACDPGVGCVASATTGTMSLTECQQRCARWRCNTAEKADGSTTKTCGFSTDSTLSRFEEKVACEAECSGKSGPPPPEVEWYVYVLCSLGGLLLVGIVAAFVMRQRAKAQLARKTQGIELKQM